MNPLAAATAALAVLPLALAAAPARAADPTLGALHGSTGAPPAGQLAFAMGVAAPTGQVGVRYITTPMVEHGPSVTVGGGLGFTGLQLALGVDQRIATLPDGAELALYGGGSVGVLQGSTRGPWSDPAGHIPSGLYTWLDAGVRIARTVGPVRVHAGGGLAMLVADPGVTPTDQQHDSFAVLPEW